MSLEDFKRRYPVSPEIKKAVQRERETIPDHSLVFILAQDLVTEGGRGLREIMRKTSGSNVAIRPTREELLKYFTPGEMEQIVLHHSAIIFGASVQGIEDALITNVFSENDLCSRHNHM